MAAIFWKELGDHFGRRRFLLLFAWVLFGVFWGLFVLAREVHGDSRSADEFLFLQIFTRGSGVLPPVLFFISFFGPLVAIALGFDTINSERTQGTLARILAQPVHRDSVITGKFLAGALTLAIMLISMALVLVGLGMFAMGFAPRGEEVLRLIGFGAVAIVYLSFWLALATTCSIFMQNAVASALVAMGIWLFASFFLALLIAPAFADLVVPEIDTAADAIRHFNISLWVSRLSPGSIFSEATQTLMDPLSSRGAQSLDFVLAVSPERIQGLLASPLGAGQSLLLVWPHIVALFSMLVVLFTVSYAKFTREEIRS